MASFLYRLHFLPENYVRHELALAGHGHELDQVPSVGGGREPSITRTVEDVPSKIHLQPIYRLAMTVINFGAFYSGRDAWSP